ncbi:MAG: response regulator [Salinivirgaceae bacterium]|nr:response regulator [Salinivirgaceae bacterium]MBO7594821.1 response regulator [Salinivirgaceae bacterium]
MKDEKSAILLVDDSSTNNLLLQTVLEKNGFTTEVAFTGKDALKILKKKKISIILLDLMMPGMSGQEVLEAVKSNPETAQIPVLVVSAYNDRTEKERVMGMGANFFFEKPLRLNEVVDKVKEILG